MYSISNIISSFNVVHFAEMNIMDFNNFITIYREIKKLEEVNTIRKIAIKNSKDALTYVSEITQKLNKELKIPYHEIHEVSLEYIIKAILLNQTFIENVKNYSNELTGGDKKEIHSWIRDNESLQFLRILRNYTYHNTIPISTSEITWNILSGEFEDIKIILLRDKLIKNLEKNNRDISFISMLNDYLDEKVNIVDFFSDWIKEIDSLYEIILKFISKKLANNINIFNGKFYDIFISTSGYVVEFHKDGTYEKFIIDKELFDCLVRHA